MESHFHHLDHLDVLLGVSGLDWVDKSDPVGVPKQLMAGTSLLAQPFAGQRGLS